MCEMPQTYHERVRKARKEHSCCECGEKILPGQEYKYISGVWDGRGDDFKQCLRCEELWNWLFAEVNAECVGLGDLYNSIRDYGVMDQVPRELMSAAEWKDYKETEFDDNIEPTPENRFDYWYQVIDWSK